MKKTTIYQKEIIKQLYFEQALSCSALSKKLGKSLPLTANIINEYINEGSIVENGLAPSTGGRRAVTYALKPDFTYVVSVAMDQFVTRIAIMDMQNKPVIPIKNLDLLLKDNKKALASLTEVIVDTIKESAIPLEKFSGIGIGMPGLIDFGKGINHSFLETTDKSITAHIQDTTGIPVFIDNDSSLIALAEHRFGKAKGKKTVMVINIGWGIGLGMLFNGSLFRGNNGLAGEFSHIPLFTNNKLCSCGKMGCLETETSLHMIAEEATNALKEGELSFISNFPHSNAEEMINAVIKAASSGDRYAISLLSKAGYNIGRGASILIHLFNPGLIILSGRGSLAGRLWLAPIQQAVNEHCIPKIAAYTEIEISSLGYDVELIGATALVMEHYNEIKSLKTKKVAKSA